MLFRSIEGNVQCISMAGLQQASLMMMMMMIVRDSAMVLLSAVMALVYHILIGHAPKRLF